MIFYTSFHKQRLWNLLKRFQFDEKQHLDLLFKIGNTRPCQLVGDGWSQSPDWIKWRKVRAIVLSFPDTTYCLLLCISSSGLDQDFLGFQMPMIRNGEKLPKMWLSLLTFKIEWKKAPCSILIFFCPAGSPYNFVSKILIWHFFKFCKHYVFCMLCVTVPT